MKLLIKLALSALAVVILANILPGVSLADPIKDALLVAIVLVILNVLVKPLLIIFTLPITIITFGLFLLFVNAIIIYLADKLLDGFTVSSVWWAIIFSICLSFLQSLFNSAIKEDKK